MVNCLRTNSDLECDRQGRIKIYQKTPTRSGATTPENGVSHWGSETDKELPGWKPRCEEKEKEFFKHSQNINRDSPSKSTGFRKKSKKSQNRVSRRILGPVRAASSGMPTPSESMTPRSSPESPKRRPGSGGRSPGSGGLEGREARPAGISGACRAPFAMIPGGAVGPDPARGETGRGCRPVSFAGPGALDFQKPL